MRRILSGILTVMLVLAFIPAAIAEEGTLQTDETVTEEYPLLQYDYSELTVAVTTPMTGCFFTSMWGNNSSDIDVRMMIHGYNLVQWDVEKGVFVPDGSVVTGIAASQSENGDVTFTIALAEDLSYCDGTRITAWDYAFSILLTIAPELNALGASAKKADYIRGYDEYISGESSVLSGVSVVSDYMLSVTIRGDYLPFFYELGLLDCNPYPINVLAPGVTVADNGEGIFLTDENGNTGVHALSAELLRSTILDETSGYLTHPEVTCGPYRLTSFKNGEARFELNPLYKGDSEGRKPVIQTVVFRSMANEEMIPAWSEGKVVLLNKVTAKQTISEGQSVAISRPQMKSANYLRSGLSFISFNTERTPMEDVRVRQAIAYAADREVLTRESVGDYGLRSNGYYGLGQWMYLLVSGTNAYPVEETEESDPEKYAEQIAAWEELSLEELEHLYDTNPEKAAELLDGAGWKYNEKGEVFNPEQDRVRYAQTDEGLKPLRLTLAYGKGSAAADTLENTLPGMLADIGIELIVTAIPAADLLSQYYRQTAPEYDMLFLATNFDVCFDPSAGFYEAGDGTHVWSSSGLADETLWQITVDMRQTAPGDFLGYCTKWLEFQKKYMEILPALPVYCNAYFDFYPRELQEYEISSSISWPLAIHKAYLAEYTEETITEELEETP